MRYLFVTFLFLLSFNIAQAAFPGDYSLYQEVEIDPDKVPGDLTDYVVYVDLADMDVTGTDMWDTVRSDCGDIRVTKSDGTTQLAREIVSCNTGTKTGEMHVKYDGTLSSSATTTMRVWYNGTDTEPAVSATYGLNNVWTDYEFVWHLDEDPSGTAPQMIDSTGNGEDGTSSGSMTTSDEVTAKIGNGLSFDGSNDVISAATGLLGQIQTSGEYHISLWVLNDTAPGWFNMVFGINNASTDPVMLSGDFSNSNNTKMRHNSTSGSSDVIVAADSAVWNETWNKITMRWNGSTVYTRFNGAAANSAAATDIQSTTNTQPPDLGGRSANSDGYVQMLADELRVSLVDLGANWDETEYNNQSSPSTFYFVGTEQGGGAGGDEGEEYVLIFSLLVAPPKYFVV